MKRDPAKHLRVASKDHGRRLDVLLAQAYPKYSRSFLQKMLKSGGVTRGAQAMVSPNYRVQAGDIFEIMDFERDASGSVSPGHKDPAADTGGPPILFEDEALLVIDKPAGLVVHPAPGHRGQTVIDWLRRHLGPRVVKLFTDPERLGLVHRLDKNTSGVLLIAKSALAQTAISRQFRDRTIEKTYVAFVEGVPSARKGVISAPVARSRKNPARMAVTNYGRPSETAFEVEETFSALAPRGEAPNRRDEQEVSQVKVHPKTGRTHQIRVHLAAIGHPIVGDVAYGSKDSWKENFGVERPLLHAEQLSFRHPLTEKMVRFKAPWPKDFLNAQNVFRAASRSALVAMMFVGLYAGAARSDDTSNRDASPPPPAPHKVVHHTAGTTSSGVTASAFRSLKRQAAATQERLDKLEQTISALQQQTSTLQTTIENMNAEERFRNLDHAIAELNSKAVASSTAAEETKSGILEVQRKLKASQDALDQLRDQIDRLQRAVIEQKAQQDAGSGSSSAPPASPGTGR